MMRLGKGSILKVDSVNYEGQLSLHVPSFPSPPDPLSFHIIILLTCSLDDLSPPLTTIWSARVDSQR